MKQWFTKLWKGYSFVGFMIINILVALVLLNGALWGAFSVKDSFLSNPVSIKYGDSAVSKVYPDYSESEVDELLKETWSRPYIYEPFTQFQERPFRGKYVNVTADGFRVGVDQGSWPPQEENINIFMFGGSTLFGYGVADNETISSYLQSSLMNLKKTQKVYIYNFGRGFYYSTQERILFEGLLSSGYIPDIAIFVDGLNDFYYNTDEPLFTSKFKEFVSGNEIGRVGKNLVLNTAIGRAATSIGARLSNISQDKNDREVADIYDDSDVIDFVINRYLSNKRLIEAVSKSFDVQPVFVWQPAPTYNYDQQYHLFSEGGYGAHTYSRYGYKVMNNYLKNDKFSDNFLWCADLQKNSKEPLYVDKVHYSSKFSSYIAQCIEETLIESNLIILKSLDSN